MTMHIICHRILYQRYESFVKICKNSRIEILMKDSYMKSNNNRLLYNSLYNMEFYCTSPYCFEIRIGRDAEGVESNTGFFKTIWTSTIKSILF